MENANGKSILSEKRQPASVCPDPRRPFGDRTEEHDLFDAMPLRERNRAGLSMEACWFDYLGKALWVSFALLVLTGIALLAGYRPTVDGSFSSVEYIQRTYTAGWWLRGIHKYATDLFVILAAIRLFRLAYRRAYKQPGELSWISAIVVLLFGVISGLTGYLLVWNQRAFWRGRILGGFAGSGQNHPLGELGLSGWLSEAVVGSTGMNQPTLTVIFVTHLALSVVFLLFVMYWSLAARHQSPRVNAFSPSIPARLWLTILGALTLLALFIPPPLGSPFDRAFSPHPIAADWYLLAFYQVFHSISPGFAVAALVTGIGIAILLPWLDIGRAKGPRPMMTAIISAVIVTWVIMTLSVLGSWLTGWMIGLSVLVWIVALSLGFWCEIGRPGSGLTEGEEVTDE
jgi:quinol-cytochrome oxidoreductase complex cytochrome b subunit